MASKRKKNYLTPFGQWWFEFWRPGQAAALEAENKRNAAAIAANRQQDILEADTTILLSQLQADYEGDMKELYQNLAIIAVIGIILFLLLK